MVKVSWHESVADDLCRGIVSPRFADSIEPTNQPQERRAAVNDAGCKNLFGRMLCRARAVTLPPHLTTPFHVREALLDRVEQAERTAQDERERQDAADWRCGVASATDAELWNLYRDQWGPDVDSRRFRHQGVDAQSLDSHDTPDSPVR